MSAADVEKKNGDETMMMFCASCGTAGGDDIKLKDCSACHLVKYCSVKCQKEHRPKHKKECKKRVAELHDELLFKQPGSSHFGDCPICCLPLPLDHKKSIWNTCCSKQICNGCNRANKKREIEERLQHKCPFCRKTLPKSEKENNEQVMKRIEANDPDAIRQMGNVYQQKGDYKAAFEYWTRAAALGDVMANYQLSCLYYHGKGVEKDEKRSLHHAEQAAIGGHPRARHNLGCMEKDNGRVDRAAKHYIIAAKLGVDESLECVKDLYKAGYVSKEDFAAALRGHQAAVDATKSPLREEAAGAELL
jgi:TPR repeat protein